MRIMVGWDLREVVGEAKQIEAEPNLTEVSKRDLQAIENKWARTFKETRGAQFTEKLT